MAAVARQLRLGSLLVTFMLKLAAGSYDLGPCMGPGNPQATFYTDVYARIIHANSTLVWWPTFRTEDTMQDAPVSAYNVSCGHTGDFTYKCALGPLSCQTNLEPIYELCRQHVFNSCKNDTTVLVPNGLSS